MTSMSTHTTAIENSKSASPHALPYHGLVGSSVPLGLCDHHAVEPGPVPAATHTQELLIPDTLRGSLYLPDILVSRRRSSRNQIIDSFFSVH